MEDHTPVCYHIRTPVCFGGRLIILPSPPTPNQRQIISCYLYCFYPSSQASDMSIFTDMTRKFSSQLCRSQLRKMQPRFCKRQPDNHERQPDNHERQSDDHERQSDDCERQPDDHERQPNDQERQPDNHEVSQASKDLHSFGQQLSQHLRHQGCGKSLESGQSQISDIRSILGQMEKSLRTVPSDKPRMSVGSHHTTNGKSNKTSPIGQCWGFLTDLERALNADTLRCHRDALITKVENTQQRLDDKLPMKKYEDISAKVFSAYRDLQASYDSAFHTTTQVKARNAENLARSVKALDDQFTKLFCARYVQERQPSTIWTPKVFETDMPEANKTDTSQTDTTATPGGVIYTEYGHPVAREPTFTKDHFSDLFSSFRSINGQAEKLCLSVDELWKQLSPAMKVILDMKYMFNHPEVKTSRCAAPTYPLYTQMQ